MVGSNHMKKINYMGKVDIVLVHTGNYFYDYINDCIDQLTKYDFNIHMIISNKLENYITNRNINICLEQDLIDDDISSFSIKNIDSNFRDGFWNRCSLRFLLISKYAKIKNLTNFFHIENDVLLFSDFQLIRSKSIETNKSMIIVSDSFRCIPSVVFFRDEEISQELSNFITKNNTVSDMDNLFLFFENNRDKVDNFPIFPDGFGDKYSIDYKNINFQNLFSDFNSIFDGAAIGQYLGGIDPINSRYRDTIGFVNETCVFNVSKYKYVWKNYEPFMRIGNIDIKVNNLHIHSKNLKRFIKKEL